MKQNVKRILLCTLAIYASAKVQPLRASLASSQPLADTPCKSFLQTKIPNLKEKIKNTKFKSTHVLYTVLKDFTKDPTLNKECSTYNDDLRNMWKIKKEAKLKALALKGIEKENNGFTEKDIHYMIEVMEIAFSEAQNNKSNANISRQLFPPKSSSGGAPREKKSDTSSTISGPQQNGKITKKSSFNKLRWLVGSGVASCLLYIIYNRSIKPEKTTNPMHTK